MITGPPRQGLLEHLHVGAADARDFHFQERALIVDLRHRKIADLQFAGTRFHRGKHFFHVQLLAKAQVRYARYSKQNQIAARDGADGGIGADTGRALQETDRGGGHQRQQTRVRGIEDDHGAGEHQANSHRREPLLDGRANRRALVPLPPCAGRIHQDRRRDEYRERRDERAEEAH